MSDAVPTAVANLITGAREVAHLATSVDDKPHVAPLWYRYAGDDLVEIVTTGKKLDNIRHNSHVALSIERDDEGHPEWAVSLFGTATVVEEAEVQRRATRRINEKYGADPDDWAENTLVRIDVGSVSYQTY